jgi:hypothetical protein
MKEIGLHVFSGTEHNNIECLKNGHQWKPCEPTFFHADDVLCVVPGGVATGDWRHIQYLGILKLVQITYTDPFELDGKAMLIIGGSIVFIKIIAITIFQYMEHHLFIL